MWVVDSSDKSLLEESKNELNIVLQDQSLVKAEFLILFNKQDKEPALSMDEIQAFFELEKMEKIYKRQIKPFLCSVNNNETILAAINWLCDTIDIKKSLSENCSF